jgi:hypothetical protein
MDWIKRNLYFLIGSLVAVALMGLAGWSLYSKWQLNNDLLGQLDEQYATLRQLYEQNPHPGNNKIDNIKNARDQQKELRAYIAKARQYFQTCPPIPASGADPLTSQRFSSALSRTLDQLQREADQDNVTLPPKDSQGNTYSFSFAAQRQSLAYTPGSLQPLSVQLGEVKAICDILFAAKINSLDNLRRERVSDDDLKGPQTDYLPDKSVTNNLAVLSPYELTFRCFSGELASVLAGYASSPYSLVIKSINVEPAPATASSEQNPITQSGPVVAPYNPPAVYQAPRPEPRISAEDAFRARYGLGGSRYAPRPQPQPVNPQRYYVQQTAAPVNKGGLPPALDENLLKVTLTLNVVKLLPLK